MTDHYLAWKDWQSADFGRFGLEDSLTFRQELRTSGIESVKGLNVAELGFGNGVFAGWVRAGGGNWAGREAIPELQKRAAQSGFQIIATEDDFSSAYGGEGLDLIVAFDVLEHLGLEDIRSFLGEAKAALKPGGTLLARLPCGDSPFSGSIFYGDLTHRTLLGSGAIRQLALEAGLEVFQVRAPALPIWGLGPMRAARRMAVGFLRMLTFSFIRTVLMGHGDAVLSPNMIVVLKKMRTVR